MRSNLSQGRRAFLFQTTVILTLSIVSFGLTPGRQALRAKTPNSSFHDDYDEQKKVAELGLSSNVRANLDANLKQRVADIDSVCKLSPMQKKKLLLAGHGDIKHFFELMRACELRPGITAPRLLAENGLFHDNSLLFKSIDNTLNANQRRVYEPVIDKIRRQRMEQAVSQFLEFAEHQSPFHPGEREKIIAVLKEIPPPGNDGNGGWVYLAIRLTAFSKKHPARFTVARRQWLKSVEDLFNETLPQLSQAGYMTEEAGEDGGEPDRGR